MDKTTIQIIINKAAEEGQKAAVEQFSKLQAAGPRYAVYNADLSGKPTSGIIGTMLDNCGGAWINLPGRHPFVNAIKKNFKNRGFDSGINSSYEGEKFHMRKGTYKGYTLHIDYSLKSRQEMSIHEEANNAMSKVLKANLIPCSVHTYID